VLLSIRDAATAWHVTHYSLQEESRVRQRDSAEKLSSSG
jgi:hypothetical protein